MRWLTDLIDDLLGQTVEVSRSASTPTVGQVEQLERRLCLGSMTGGPTENDDATPTPSQQASAVDPSLALEIDLTQDAPTLASPSEEADPIVQPASNSATVGSSAPASEGLLESPLGDAILPSALESEVAVTTDKTDDEPVGITVEPASSPAEAAPRILVSQDAQSEGLMIGGETSAGESNFAAAQTSSEPIQAALHSMMAGFPQLSETEVDTLLRRAAAVSSTEDAIIAVVDRNGTILGVRAEQGVLDTITDPATLAFAIDGAVAKARTAAFFANGEAGEHSTPLTSRLVRFVSQSTVTQREVESNPNITDPDSTLRGPGFVAPIGLGGHFPPEIANTPVVDLFAIEHTNRDSLTHPGADNIKGTADDIPLAERFNIDPTFVPAGQSLAAPLSYGEDSGVLPDAQSRGIATLPGGIPLFRDTNSDGVGDTLVGGIGVFFPGPDGFATFEQGFIQGANQTELERTNADRVLEAEFIALAAAGGSRLAQASGAPGAMVGDVDGIPPVDGLDLPFGNLSLVGINLQVVGPKAGIEGVRQLLRFGRNNLEPGDSTSGANQVLGGGVFLRDGRSVPEGVLVTPHDSAVDDLTAADVTQIIDAARMAADRTRAAVRLEEGDLSPGARTRMVFAITDTTGEVLGLFRMDDATVFSIDVAVAKARNVAYYADATALQPEDQIDGVDAGTAFTNRTFRFVAEPRFPDGVDGSNPSPFSILNNSSIDPTTGENIGAPAPASSFDSVLGFDAFNPGTNFRDPDDIANQNGVVFFPGSTPLYKDGVLVGGLGVSGDGVDQDDVVTFLAAEGFLPDGVTVGRADQTIVDGVRLPYIKFLRNPFG